MAGRKRSASDARPGASKKRRTSTRKMSRRTVSTFAPEMKYFDSSFSQTVASNADWTGTEVPCTNYIQSDGTTVGTYTDSALIPSAIGSGYGQVVGTKYLMKALRVRGTLIPSASSDQADVLPCRSVTIALVHDTQPNGSQAQGEDVFYDMGSAVQVNDAFQAMGAGAGGRFKILYRKTYLLQPGVTGTDGANTQSVVNNGARFEITKQWKRGLAVHVKGNSAVPTVASLTDNNIFLLAHVNSTTSLAINGVARAYYMD